MWPGRSPDPSSSHTQHSRGEGRGARPRATDEQLVGVGQGGCVLPSRKEGIRCGVRCEPGGGSRQLFTMPKRCTRRRHNTSRAARARANKSRVGGWGTTNVGRACLGRDNYSLESCGLALGDIKCTLLRKRTRAANRKCTLLRKRTRAAVAKISLQRISLRRGMTARFPPIPYLLFPQ